MKKFFLSIFAVSFFFLGLGALVDQSGAKSKSDERALELVRKARIAIGGDAAINSVQSMRIVGSTTKTFTVDGVARTENGETEIALQFPDKLMRSVKLGDGNGAGEAHRVMTRQVDVATTGDAKDKMKIELKAAGDGSLVERRVVVRKDDGSVVELKGDEAAQWIAKHPVPEGAKTFTVTKKGDGTENHEVVVVNKGEGGNATFTTKDGNVVTLKDKTYTMTSDTPGTHEVVVVRKGDGDATFTTKDGNVITLKEHDAAFRSAGGGVMATGVKSNEMLRTTLSLLLTAPQGMDVSYTFVGESDVDGTACNVVKAEFGGSAYKLFLDRSSNLPVAISYRGMPAPHVVKLDKAPVGDGKQDMVFARSMASAKELADIQIKFSDFRNTGGVLLPYRWAETRNAKEDEIFDVTSYEINPANIAERFQHQKVMVRTNK